MITLKDRLRGCLIGGAIGDAIGGRYEGSSQNAIIDLNFNWSVSDDTQLTIATCEAIFDTKEVRPEKVAARFLDWYNRRKLTGLGSSTLKALRELQVGGHWALVGRSGEYAAGNGAAMRIAPLAFKQGIDRQTIKDICTITHKNDEAYAGALAIYYAVKNAITGKWVDNSDLLGMIIPELPDTRVKDRCMELEKYSDQTISQIGERFRPTGYVVDSVPVAVFAAQQIGKLNFEAILTELIKIGGDTDTTCPMTGQIIAALKGEEIIPINWIAKYNNLEIKELIDNLARNWNE